MSKKYVDQLIKTHIENLECTKCFHFTVCSRHMGGMDLSKCEDFTPISDVAPVTHGEWIKGEENSRKRIIECSHCKTGLVLDNSEPNPNYCLNCGARMGGNK